MFKDYYAEHKHLYDKAVMVIESCKTSDQLVVAQKYVDKLPELWSLEIYRHDLKCTRSPNWDLQDRINMRRGTFSVLN